jgi:prepilin-type N-terminal cleavage/methylation domain-containing protein
MKTNKKAFTLVNVLVVIAVIGILSGIISLALSKSTANAKTPSEVNKQLQTDLFNNQAKLVEAVPAPQMETSLERKNIARRAELFNVENKISYIYLVNYGKVMAFYTITGKISNVSAYLVPQEQLVYGDGQKCSSWSSDCYIVQAPDIDGAYGTNGEGIFFFTTEGAYVEWKGDYMLSDQPLRISTPVELVREVK